MSWVQLNNAPGRCRRVALDSPLARCVSSTLRAVRNHRVRAVIDSGLGYAHRILRDLTGCGYGGQPTSFAFFISLTAAFTRSLMNSWRVSGSRVLLAAAQTS